MILILCAGMMLIIASIPGTAVAQEDLPPGWEPPGEDPPPPEEDPPEENPPGWEPGDPVDDPSPSPTPAPTPSPTPSPAPSPSPSPAPTPSPSPSPSPPIATTTSDVILAQFIDDGPSSLLTTITASPNSVPLTGALVLFDVVIENTSAVDSVTIDRVVDSQFGDITTSCFPALPTSVAAGATILCSYREKVTGDGPAVFENAIVVSGIDDDGDSVTAETSAAIGVEAAIDLEVTVTAERANVSAGAAAVWDVVVANRGPSEATGVLFRMTQPGASELEATGCVLYRNGLEPATCDFNALSGIARVASIPSGAAFAVTMVTMVDAVGDLELVAEVIRSDQRDLDSAPRDRRGDDVGAAQILMTVERAESVFERTVSVSRVLPLWPLVLLLGLLALAVLLRVVRPWHWRFR